MLNVKAQIILARACVLPQTSVGRDETTSAQAASNDAIAGFVNGAGASRHPKSVCPSVHPAN